MNQNSHIQSNNENEQQIEEEIHNSNINPNQGYHLQDSLLYSQIFRNEHNESQCPVEEQKQQQQIFLNLQSDLLNQQEAILIEKNNNIKMDNQRSQRELLAMEIEHEDHHHHNISQRKFSGQVLNQNYWKYQSNLNNDEKYERYDSRKTLYKKRQIFYPLLMTLLPNEPYMKLTVLRNNTDINEPVEYKITSRGLINSKRNTDHDDIIIGRQQATIDGIIPNDICLQYSDRAISRVHCKIITKYGFKVPRKIPNNFVSFLMMSHKRLGNKSPGYNLPFGIYHHIFSFIKEPRKFWLVDLGSVFGTYVRIKPYLKYRVEKGQTYLIGADTQINIIEVNNNNHDCHYQQQQQQQFSWQGDWNEMTSRNSPNVNTIEDMNMNDNQYNKQANFDEFLKYLAREKFKNKYDIHGLDQYQQDYIQSIIPGQKELLEENHILNQTQRNTFKFMNILVGGQDQNSTFVIGRLQDCDIAINQNTISRRQCRFICENGYWYIADGANERDSANGTWISLTDYRFKKDRVESDPRSIDHLTEIKISDTILRVEIIGNE